MAEPYLIYMEREGMENSGRLAGYTLAGVFGKAVTTAPDGSVLLENESLIGAIRLTETVIEKAAEESGRYTVSGKLALPQGWETYATYIREASDFTGSASIVKLSDGYRIAFSLEAPLSGSFPFERAEYGADGIRRVKHSMIGANRLSLALAGQWQGEGEVTKESLAAAEFSCRLKLDELGEVDLRHRLFRGNAWVFTVNFSPALSLANVAAFIGKLVGAPEVVSSIVLPEGIVGLDFLQVSGLVVTLSPQLLIQSIEVLLTMAAAWKPGVPYFSVEELGISLYFSIPTQEQDEVYAACGISGIFLIRPKKGLNLRLAMWCDIPGLTASGELLAVQEQEYEPPLTELLSAYGVPSADVDGLTVASLRYVASVPGRSLWLEFEMDTSQMLSFSILGLPISVTEISGDFSYHPDALSLTLGGQLRIGKEQSFLLGLSFSYDCEGDSGWHFTAALMEGEVSVAAVLTDLFGVNTLRDDPVFDLKLTDFAAEFYSNDRGPFTVRAALEQPWSTRLLGVNLILFGSVDMTKAVDGTRSGTLMAGFRLNAFQMKVLYGLAGEADYRFQIWYENAYLEARYEKREEKELLVLGLKGMTLYGLVSGFVHMVNPNADFKLSAPWDILERIRLDDFSLEFDMENRTVSMLYAAELNILGLVEIRQIGIRYSRRETGKVEFVLVGSFLEQEYTIGDPLTWDAIDDNPPDIGGSGNQVLRLSYLGMGQHFGTEALLSATRIAEAVEALKNAIHPVDAGERPKLSYAEGVNWLFGADMTYRGMLRVQFVLNDPSLYGILITVKQGEDSALAQFAGLSLQLLYRKVTDDIGMFSAELMIPDRFKVLRFGAISVTLGRFYMEIYTNGNFYLDLGFPHRQDFGESFVVEAGYYTGRGGFYFGILSQETCEKVPKIVNGRFAPVIAIGVGLSLGIGRSFDFAVVKGAVSLEFFAIFEGLFAVYTPADTSQKKDFYYHAKAVAGIYGRLFLSVDFVILAISATAEVRAYASVELASCQPVLFAVDLDLKVGASIKILFIKISFSFHFSMHMDFSIGEASKTPWKLADKEHRRYGAAGYAPYLFHRAVDEMYREQTLCVKRDMLCDGERVDIAIRILPLYTVMQPALEPYAAFLLLAARDETGFAQIVKIAQEWIVSHLEETVSCNSMERLFGQLREETEEFTAYFKKRTRLVLTAVPENAADMAEEDGVFFPVVPGMLYRFMTFDAAGELIYDETNDFAEEPKVDAPYMEMLSAYFARLNPAPEDVAGAQAAGKTRSGMEEAKALSEVLLEDYLAVILQAVTKEVSGRMRRVEMDTRGRTLNELAESWDDMRIPFCKRHGETWQSVADEVGMPVDALRDKNSRREESELSGTADGTLRYISVGVTPHSILLDNPAWRFSADTITVEGEVYAAAGMSVEQVMRENRIPLDALVRAIGDERAVLRDERIVIRNVPFFTRDKVRGMLGASEIAEQAAGMVSRFFLQGLRLPIPNAPEGMRRDAAFLNRRENWAGLYQIIGQQKKLQYEKDAAEDFLRHRLAVTAAAGYEEWIAAGEEYAVEISNEEIAANAPDALFVPVFEQELREIKPYVLEKRQHPFAEYLLHVTESGRGSILTFTKDFMRAAEGHFSDYAWYADSMQSGFGRTMGANLTGEDRKGGFGLLLALNINKVDESRPAYEVTVTDKGSSAKLYAVKNADAVNVNLLYEPSAVDGREEGLYDLPLQKEHTRLVMTNLSRETKSSPKLRAQETGQDVAYVASAAEPAAFLALLWQLSVTNVSGYYLCLAEEEIPESLFSSAGAGKLWLLVTGDIGETGCNCIVDEQEITSNEYAWLALKDECAGTHPQEYAVKSILNPGSAGFAAVLAQPQNPDTCKEDTVRNLYSILNYRVHGYGYEDCETGMPLLPKEPKDGANVWEYSQSVPLDRFLESGSDNPYDAVGMSAELELEFRDVLGNTAEAGKETDFRLGITPRYNDALLAIDQTGAVAAGYMVKDGQLLLAVEPALRGALQEKKREEVLAALEKSGHQIQAAGTRLCLESTLLAAAVPLPCGDILALYEGIRSWLVWTKSLNRIKCAVLSLKEAADCYGKTPDELLGENLEVSLTKLFGETRVSYPIMKIWHSGASLAGMESECGWEENKDALLRAGTEVIISKEAGREYIVPAERAAFAQAAGAIGCDVASLVEDNREKKGILSEGYEFAFQGYEVEVGSEAGVTASLSDVCAAFAVNFEVDVTPMELAAEETVGILAEGVTLIYRKLTAAEGETLSHNHMGCSAEQLWNLNFDTKDFLAEGTAVWCATETVDAAEAVDIRTMCQVYGITTTQFYLANCKMPLQNAELLTISGNIAYPQTAYQNSFVLPENGGAGYSIAGICRSYGCENGVWFYRMLQDILIEGREIKAAQATVTVSRFDTLESVERKLRAIGAKDQNIWMDAVIVKDGITLPLVPAGIIFREQIDERWIRSRQDILLKLDVKLHLCREANIQEETPEDIYHAWSTVLPGDGCNPDTSFDEFVAQAEASMPFAYVVQGVESQGTENDLYLWLAKGDGTKGISDIKFGPLNIYDDTVKTPAIYALAPISTKLVSREAVEIAQLEADGTLGEAEVLNFTGIDIERWAVLFLEDVEAMLSPRMVEKAAADGCMEQLARLLVIKEQLAQKLPSRLCHVLVPLGQSGQEGMAEAKSAFSKQLRVSLPNAYGKNVLLQYPGAVAMEGTADCVYRLAGDVIIRDFAEPVSMRAGKIGLENGAVYLHVFAEAARLRNASFSLEKMQYHIRELEMLPQQERGDYLQSGWFSFLNPVDETRYGKNMELELSCALPVPVPLRFYPKQPVLKEHRIVLPQQEERTGDIAEYLTFDYRVTFVHEMAGADMIYLTVVFNEKPKAYVRDNAKDLFDALAQYVSVREELQKMLKGAGQGFQGAYQTMVALADDAAQRWDVFGECEMVSSLQETTYACHMRTWYDNETLRIELFTQEHKLPELYYISPDGTEVHMQSEQTADGAVYWVSGISEAKMSADITLCLSLKGLSIFEYQSVYTRSHVTRNEALSDAEHPVNERFLYRTEDTAFASPMNVLISHEKEIPVVIPKNYEPKKAFAERAVRYLFEEIFHMGEQNAQISCQIAYGYHISEADLGAGLELPVCLLPRTGYSDALRQSLSDSVTRWYDAHRPPERGRYLRMEVTIFGTELEEEGLPIVRLGGIKISG